MEETRWVDVRPRRGVNWYLVGAIASGIALLALIAAIAVAVFGDGDLFGNKESEVESLCVEDLKEQLRDPESAEFYDLNDVTKLEGDDGDMYGFEGKLRSRNGFGGMVNSQFSCGVIYKGGEPEVYSWTY